LNKSQFIEAIAERLGGDKKAAGAAVDAFVQTVYANVVKGEKVSITGFGIFERRDRAARVARNPRTGESVRVKKTSAPAFRAGAEFKAVTSGAKKLPKVAPAKATKVSAAKAAPVRASAARGAAAAPAKATRSSAATATATKSAAKAAPAKKAPAKTAAAAKAAPAKKAPAKTAAAAKAAPAKKAPAKTAAAAKAAPARKAPAKRAAR
jgi:DNA-binding protein HU-beta